jgi:poly-gamma-glutamate capsule biosynthesis protein CapA/YwtB (metallophosphatase superfamily)
MKRRSFLKHTAKRLILLMTPVWLQQNHATAMHTQNTKNNSSNSSNQQLITLFLCGDVMTGRGIDQVLPYPSQPEIYEHYVLDARSYVELAEERNGPITKPVSFPYIWGDALTEFERVSPDLRIINLETSVTRSNHYWKGKGINYRMHPDNIPCLTAANIDGCTLANNHVLDWGHAGLKETLATLKQAHIKTAGAGANAKEAQTPALFEIPGKGRVILFSFGDKSSGLPYDWKASENKAGVNMLNDLSKKTVRQIANQVNAVKGKNDIVIASIHWGGNWGYNIPNEHTRFAHDLIDNANVDVVHGHSSHHPKGIEVYRNKPIIYGCGDFINDYEGISGYEQYRDDLSLMYFITLNTLTGELVRFQLVPTQIKQFRVNYATHRDTIWLADMLNREGKKLNTKIKLNDDKTMTVHWTN